MHTLLDIPGLVQPSGNRQRDHRHARTRRVKA